MKKLTAKQKRFVEEYLIDLNATQAAIRAGYSERTAHSIGHELLRKPEIQAAIAEKMAERSKRVEVTADRVLEEWWAIATADPNELIEYRRTCCRHCYGENFDYQRTTRERERDYEAWAKKQTKASKEEFWEAGGIGFDGRKPPNPSCPECFGEGIERVFAKDTRYLSKSGRALYAGVKQTKDGLEIKMHGKMDALANVARHLGMFDEKSEPPESEEDRIRRIRAGLAEMDAATVGTAA